MPRLSRRAIHVVRPMLVVGAAVHGVKAFVPGLPATVIAGGRVASSFSTCRNPTGLNDINEWRDTVFDLQIENDSDDDKLFDASPPREICVLPFPINDCLLQGETKQLRLYEERFLQLFDDAMDNYGGVVAMGLIADQGIISSAPLCEIVSYNRMGDGLGIFATIQAVSRVAITGLTKDTPYIKATCKEIFDVVPQKDADVKLLSTIAGNVENMMVMISAMEHRLKGAVQSASGQDDLNIDDDDDDDDDDITAFLDRTGRFRRAYELAKETDTQGYISSTLLSEDNDDPSEQRSLQDLSAISWAAFETERLHEDDEEAGIVVREDGSVMASSDTLYRIQAIASTGILDRMKLALTCLHNKRVETTKALKEVGLKYEDDM